MKITCIIDHLANDGAGTENQVMKLVRGLAERHVVELISLRSSPWLQAQQQAGARYALSVFELNGIRELGFWMGLRRLRRHLAATAPDVVHTFFPVANIFGVWCASRAGVPTIVASRRDYGHWMTPHYLAATRRANRMLHGIVTNSQEVKDLTVRVEGVAPEQVEVIPNGVDWQALRPAQRDLALKARLGIPAHARVLGLVANFRPVKRQDTLVQALHLLRDSHPDLHVLFVGGDNRDEPARDKVLALAQGLGLAERVHCGRAQGDIVSFLSITDIGLNCSESEGLSNAVVEYMCAGVPCVISNGGGNRDLVRDGVNGLMFNAGDAGQLAQALARLLGDEALRRRCTAAALAKVQEEMALPAVLRRFEAAYERFAAVRPRAAALSSPVRGSLVKQAAIAALASAPARRIARWVRPRTAVAVLMYHELGSDADPADVWQVVRRGEFLRQLDALRQRFDIVSLDEAHARLQRGDTGARPPAVLTFDDGDAGNAELLLPILQREALPVTVYVATGHIHDQRGYWFDRLVNLFQGGQPLQMDLRAHGLGSFAINASRGAANWATIQQVLQAMKALPVQRCEDIVDDLRRQLGSPGRPVLRPMAVAELRELAACPWVTLGSHTHGHEVLTLLDDAGVRATVQTSQALLQQWVGQTPRHFAFPGGFHDARVEGLVNAMGFATAMGGGVGLWTPQASPHAIPRLPVGRYDTLRRFGIELDWGHHLRRRQPAARAL